MSAAPEDLAELGNANPISGMAGDEPTTEATPLLGTQSSAAAAAQEEPQSSTFRKDLYAFLEAQTPAGRYYETFMITLIIINVIAFILGTLFVEDYNTAAWARRDGGICDNLCDALWFGNYRDNGLEVLNLGSTSILELITIAVFTVEYILRLYTADLESPRYAGCVGRLRFVPTFFSMVDLASTLPFYIDSFLLRDTDMAASGFVRMFRLLRMMRVEGRYNTALTMVDDVWDQQKGIMGTALFVGVTTWMTVASLYYLVERRNLDMVYCPTCGDDVDTSMCVIDDWGSANCTLGGCPPTEDNAEPCFNLYQSIPMASYYALLNLFGEFPLIDNHSVGGMIVGTLVAVVAVAVFALPAGIIGNGFETVIEQRREQQDATPIVEQGGMTRGFVAQGTSFRAKCYNFLHAQSLPGSITFDWFINSLIIMTALTFMLDTLPLLSSPFLHLTWDVVEFFAVVVFTIEYLFRLYASQEDPKYQGIGGTWKYMITFLAVVDLLSVLPYWLELGLTGGSIVTPTADASLSEILVKSLRLLRLLRFEKYTHAFTSFDDVISRNLDVLAVTGFTAVLCWVFFSAMLYFTERDNPDDEMASNYNNMPNAMWMTLLNLTGESPLCQYSAMGKVITGLLGLFATGLFGIPIGVLGAGFEQVVEEENAGDNNDGDDDKKEPVAAAELVEKERVVASASELEKTAFVFVNGMGSSVSQWFEGIIYLLILLTVGIGVWQTVPGHENDWHQLEWVAVIVFTLEYLIRFVGVPADPLFESHTNPIIKRIAFIGSFYSVIDLLAIVPFYVAVSMPSSFVNQYDEYLRMLRILRLVKLDKYVPSITLIDDVVRLKANSLTVALYAAGTLWILFAALVYLFEFNDSFNDMDNVPFYGCYDDCTMMDRFQTYLDSLFYTGVHLTGDYPITTYTWGARFVNFFMVIAAVGIVSIPSGLIASGFVEIVQSKAKMKEKKKHKPAEEDIQAIVPKPGDDWYEIRYRQLEGKPPPPSRFGPTVDAWQTAVDEFLNGKELAGGKVEWTFASNATRIFIFTVIIVNIIAVLLESVPAIDKAVGNETGNAFDTLEAFSVMVFAAEYISRLFCAPKNREALYSTFIYATTFFGIVDFLSTAPWFIEQALIASGTLDEAGDNAKIFRLFRMFRILQLEDFIVAFSKLDNVFRATKDVLKATGLLALIIWVGCGALFYIFEQNNPNWRSCDASVPLHAEDVIVVGDNATLPGCYDFATTADCNDFYPGLCTQKAFINMPVSLYATAVFLGGEWGYIDFTWPGRMVCLFLCLAGIALYAVPIGALFDSFGAVLGLAGDDDEEEEEEEGDDGKPAPEEEK